MKYLIILEPTATGYSAYSPDLDGCIAAAETREKTVMLMREAIAFHLEGLAADGQAAPDTHSESEYVEVSAANGLRPKSRSPRRVRSSRSRT